MKILPAAAELYCTVGRMDVRTDRYDEASSLFRNFENT